MRMHITGRRLVRPHAFTVVELLAVIAVLALVAGTALPGLAGTRGRNKRIACLNNLRQMGAASQMYAQEDSQGRLTGSLDTTPIDLQADDDLNWLHGFGHRFAKGYIDNLETFVCPSTRNTVGTNSAYETVYFYAGVNNKMTKLLDLDYNANSNTDTRGHSYEVKNCWGTRPAYPRKTLWSVLSYTHQAIGGGLPVGLVTGPSDTFIMLDAVEPHPSAGWPWEDWPNPYNGHGQDGANVTFADGHCEWIGRADWNYRYELSQDQGRQIAPF